MKYLIVLLVVPSLAFAQAPLALNDKGLVRQIRSEIVQDSSLPYCAHIVEVEAKDGKVSLKGSVDTEEQRTKIRRKAAAIAGEANVINNITLRGS